MFIYITCVCAHSCQLMATVKTVKVSIFFTFLAIFVLWQSLITEPYVLWKSYLWPCRVNAIFLHFHSWPCIPVMICYLEISAWLPTFKNVLKNKRPGLGLVLDFVSFGLSWQTQNCFPLKHVISLRSKKVSSSLGLSPYHEVKLHRGFKMSTFCVPSKLHALTRGETMDTG